MKEFGPDLSFIGCEANPASKWLIDGAVPANSMVMVIGKSGIGKSFLIVDMLASIYAGADGILGKSSLGGGAVAHVCLESPDDMGRRYAVAGFKVKEFLQVDGYTDFDAEDRQRCSRFAYGLNERHGGRGKLMAVAYSTLSTIAPNMDETSVDSIKHVLSNLNMIREITGATQIIEHHTSLSSDRPRGHSVMDGLMHTIINVSGGSGKLTISCRKQRVDKPFAPVHARMVDFRRDDLTDQRSAYLMPVVKGSDGSAAPSQASETTEVTPDASEVVESPTEGLTPNARVVLEFAQSNGEVSWRDMEPLKAMSRATFYNATKSLESLGMLVNVGKGAFMLPDDI